MPSIFTLIILLGLPNSVLAAGSGEDVLNLTSHWVGYASIAIFVVAYILVILEEELGLRKSKPVILAAGLIWAMIGWVHAVHGIEHTVEEAIRHTFLEYAELFFFLLVAMTYINAMLERNVFDVLRDWLIARGLGYRALFWLPAFSRSSSLRLQTT